MILKNILRFLPLSKVMPLFILLGDKLVAKSETKVDDKLWKPVKLILQRPDVFSVRTLLSLAIIGIDYFVAQSPNTVDDSGRAAFKAILVNAERKR